MDIGTTRPLPAPVAVLPWHAAAAAPAARTGQQPAAGPAASATPTTAAELGPIAAELNGALQGVTTSLRFEVSDATADIVVKLVDDLTGEILRQFPSEQVLALARRLDSRRGALVHELA